MSRQTRNSSTPIEEIRFQHEPMFCFYKFEGRFGASAAENGGAGVVSSCIVEAPDEHRASEAFQRALSSEEIALVKVLKFFEIDENDEVVQSWKKGGYKSRCEEVYFDVWHTFAWS